MPFLIVNRPTAMRTNIGRRLFVLMQLAVLILLPGILLIIILKPTVAHSSRFGGGLVDFLVDIGMIGDPLQWNAEHCSSRTICRLIALGFLALHNAITLTIFFLMESPVVDLIWYDTHSTNQLILNMAQETLDSETSSYKDIKSLKNRAVR